MGWLPIQGPLLHHHHWLCDGPDLWQFCEKNIPPQFCKKLDFGFCLRHGIMSLFNTQQSFVELELIFMGVKNSGNQEVEQKTLLNFVPFGNTCKKMQKNVSNN